VYEVGHCSIIASYDEYIINVILLCDNHTYDDTYS